MINYVADGRQSWGGRVEEERGTGAGICGRGFVAGGLRGGEEAEQQAFTARAHGPAAPKPGHRCLPASISACRYCLAAAAYRYCRYCDCPSQSSLTLMA